MRDCDKYIEMISLMIDGELSLEQEAELRTHIDACETCKRAYEAFTGISHALSDELVQPPEMLAKGVMYKINRQKKKKYGSHFAFGKFTAAAACLALVLFGASHFGLFNGLKAGSAKMASLSKTGDAAAMQDAAPEYSSADESLRATTEQPSEGEDGGQSFLTSGAPSPQCSDGTVLQFGFTEPSVMTAAGDTNTIEKEPAFLFEATKMQVYEGKYYTKETDTEKNKLLFTLETEEDLSALYELITAMPENAVEYTAEDGKILKEDPLFTLYVPVDKEKDKDAKDKTICVWFVKGEVWCVISDVIAPDEIPDPNAERIIYKAEGLQEKFEAYVTQIKKEKGIT